MGFLRHDKAFSIIELVVVIIIFSIIALVATLKFGPYDAMKVDGAARKIASDIAYAQILAMTRSYNDTPTQYIVINFNPTNDTYNITRTRPSQPVTDPFTKENFFIVDFKTGTYQGVDIVSANFIGTNLSNIYNSLCLTVFRGIPQACNDAGGFYWPRGDLSSDGEINISYHGKTRIIRVTRQTGRVYVLNQ